MSLPRYLQRGIKIALKVKLFPPQQNAVKNAYIIHRAAVHQNRQQEEVSVQHQRVPEKDVPARTAAIHRQ